MSAFYSFPCSHNMNIVFTFFSNSMLLFLKKFHRRNFDLSYSEFVWLQCLQFGKERATATYGVLPAANVPPPYALASISALQFDCCGHRFATAALDGTVCTWQLEVGGRSNVHPTQSSLCFNGHASYVFF